MPIYEKPVTKLMQEMVDDLGLELGSTVSKTQVVTWFADHYPKINKNTVTAHLIRMSTNSPTRVHYSARPGQDDLFFKIDGSRFRLYDPDTDPKPFSQKSLTHGKLDLQDTTSRTKKPRAKGTARLLSEVSDKQLKKRLSMLDNAPLDTVIREAGVVFEQRLRNVNGVDRAKFGTALVDNLFDPIKGKLIVSSHEGEQMGVLKLYQGALQFIRNPPMHNLIDYSDTTARVFIRLIDSLLELLAQLERDAKREA